MIHIFEPPAFDPVHEKFALYLNCMKTLTNSEALIMIKDCTVRRLSAFQNFYTG
jgi:hypothetical protein